MAGLLAGLFTAEVSLRLFKQPQLGITRLPCIYSQNEKTGYRYTPNTSGRFQRYFEIDNLVKINSSGFHDVEHLAWPQARPQVVVIGDSFVAGLEVEISQGWVQVMQQQLQPHYPTLEMANLGLDGTGTAAHLALLKEQLETAQPDWVILAFYRNDVKDLLNQREYRECYRGHVISYQNEAQRAEFIALVDRSLQGGGFIYGWLIDHFYLVRVVDVNYNQDDFWQNNFHHSANEKASNPADINAVFQELVTLSQQYHFKLLILPVPAKDDLTDSLDQLHEHVSASILSQIEVVDLSGEIQDLLRADHKDYSELFWEYDGHFNVYGHQIFGVAAANALDDYLRNSAAASPSR